MSGGPSCSWLLAGKTRAGTFLGPLLAPCLGHFEEVVLCHESGFVRDSFLGNEYPVDFRGRTPTVSSCLYLQFGGDCLHSFWMLGTHPQGPKRTIRKDLFFLGSRCLLPWPWMWLISSLQLELSAIPLLASLTIQWWLLAPSSAVFLLFCFYSRSFLSFYLSLW